jgi:hypothetical protein
MLINMEKGLEIKEIKSYSYLNYASRCGTNDIKAVVVLNGESGFLGYVNFMTNGCSLPKSVKQNGLYFLYYHFSDMPIIVDMLRNEKPLYLIFQDDGNNTCRISTSTEIVGEGEV